MLHDRTMSCNHMYDIAMSCRNAPRPLSPQKPINPCSPTSTCYDVMPSRNDTVVTHEQPITATSFLELMSALVDSGGRRDKMVMASPLTCLPLMSCLLSCNDVDTWGMQGYQKYEYEMLPLRLAASMRPAFPNFLIIVLDFRFLQAACVLLPIPYGLNSVMYAGMFIRQVRD